MPLRSPKSLRTTTRYRHFAREVLNRAKALAETDDRIEIIDNEVEDHGVLKLHSFYVGYLLPMMVEVQYFEFAT